MKKFETEYDQFEAMSLTSRQALIDEWADTVETQLAVIREKTAELRALAEAQSNQKEWPR